MVNEEDITALEERIQALEKTVSTLMDIIYDYYECDAESEGPLKILQLSNQFNT